MCGEVGDRTPDVEPRGGRTPTAAGPRAENGAPPAVPPPAPGPGEKSTGHAGAGTADVGTNLALERTDLAITRNYLASERTLMGWIRTALSMISFGFTIGKLGQTLQDVEIKGVLLGSRTVSVQTLAYFLVVMGTLALLAATVQHIVRVREYRAMGYPGRSGMAVWVAIILTAIGGFALVALVAKL